jgi:hypothetical protein
MRARRMFVAACIVVGACGGSSGSQLDAMGGDDDDVAVDAAPGMPDYPVRSLLHDAPYIDIDAARLFRIEMNGGHWGVVGLTLARGTTAFGIDLYSETGMLVASMAGAWSCNSGLGQSPNQTGFIAISGPQFPSGGVFFAVVHTGGEQYTVEWYEAALEIPASTSSSCGDDATIACDPFPTGHVAHAFDVGLDDGNNYALEHDSQCGCPGVSEVQSFQFVVSSTSGRPYASSSDYVSVSPTCSACGSDAIGVATAVGNDRMHGVVAIDTTGQSHATVDLCYRIEARTCAPPLAICGASCEDITSDAGHCGMDCTDCVGALADATGVACQDSACTYASCAAGHADCDSNVITGCEYGLATCPVDVVSGGNPVRFALDATHVYWSDGTTGLISKWPFAGGPSQALAQGEGGGSLIAIDATDVYYSFGGTIRKVSKAGGSSTFLIDAAGTVLDLRLDATSMYWSVIGSSYSAIWSSTKAGTSSVQLLYHSGASAIDIEIDTTHVYYLETTIIGRVLKVGGGNESLMTNVPGTSLVSLAMDPGGLYFTFGGTPKGVGRVPLAGGLPTTIAMATAPGDIVADGSALIWIDGATIRTMPIAGGSVVPLAVAQQPRHIAAGSTDIYWTNGAPLAIRSVPN